jgi:hypothetical protein
MNTRSILRDHLKAGNRGTCAELAEQLSMPKATVFVAIRQLHDAGECVAVPADSKAPTGPRAAVYAGSETLREAPRYGPIAELAIARMPDLQRVWMEATA